MTAFDDTVKALGGELLTGLRTSYGSWSPNWVKTLVLTQYGGYIEYHGYVQGTLFMFETPYDPFNLSPLHALSFKQFGALESIIAPYQMYQSINIEEYFTSQARLGGYFGLQCEDLPDIRAVADSLVRDRLAYVMESPLFFDSRPALLHTPDPLDTVRVIADVSCFKEIKPLGQACKSFDLDPQHYEADAPDGLLRKVLNTYEGFTLKRHPDTSSPEVQQVMAGLSWGI